MRAITAVACIAMTMVACSSTGRSRETVSAEPPPKSEFTQVTTSMFVDRSAVPNSPATEFTEPTVESVPPGPQDPVDPPDCGPVYWGPPATQAGTVIWSTTSTPDNSATEEIRVFQLFLTMPAERPDLVSLIGKCPTVTYQGVSTTASLLRLPGVPSWATATRLVTEGADGVGIIGLFRGLYVSVAFTQRPGGDLSSADTDALAKLFNDQVAKLEAM
jgi:hypothetical protein